MLLIDDILFFPATSILWIFREIHKNAEEEFSNQAESITEQLRNLYMQLETGGISEEQFDGQEKILLDRMDEIEAGRDRGESDEIENSESLDEQPVEE